MPAKDQQGPTGLRTIVQKRMMDDVLHNTMKKHPGWHILVMDKAATRTISSVIGMYDLMEQRISLVEDISKKRAPFRDKAVIYLLAPTKDSVEKMIADWTPSEDLKEPLYGNGAFIYFLGALPDPLLARIKSCKPLVKRVKGLGEINIDFLAKESSAFHLDMDSTFSVLFKRSGRPSRAEFVICDKLVTLCATLNEYPHVRYDASSPLSTSLAKIFHNKMNEFVGKNQNWWHHGDASHTDRGRATLLLLDRTADCLSPLMHEFTYQAMVNDLLKVMDDKISYESETVGTAAEEDGKATMTKDALLNENDEVWVELRGDHIADVIQKLSGRIRDIVNSNTAQVLKSKGNSAKALSLSQMANAMKALPEYREVMSKLSQHMHISHQCMDLFNKANLLNLSELEQTLATGKDENGRTPKVSELVDLVEEELKSSPDALTRLRLLGIFIVSQKGIRSRDKDRLLTAARLNPKAARTLQNLQKMGCPLIQKTESSKLNSIFGQRAGGSGRNDSESEYSTSRYVPLLKILMQEMNDGTLSMERYPSVVPMPDEGSSSGTAMSARNRQSITGSARRDNPMRASRWARESTKPAKRNAYSGARQIVFMAGGLCYSEIRSVYEVMNSGEKEFIVGGTRFLNPRQFARELSTFHVKQQRRVAV